MYIDEILTKGKFQIKTKSDTSDRFYLADKSFELLLLFSSYNSN